MTEPTPNPQLEKYLTAYMSIRNKRAEIKRAYEEEDNKYKDLLAKLEVALMKLMNEAGSDSLKITGVGQAYISNKIIFTVKDWDAMWNYVEESGNLDLLSRRVTQKAVKEFREANDGDLPPGVDMLSERTVNVRSA